MKDEIQKLEQQVKFLEKQLADTKQTTTGSSKLLKLVMGCCKVVYYPWGGDCPIEHCRSSNKVNEAALYAAMLKDFERGRRQ